jgi:hypothetical protein
VISLGEEAAGSERAVALEMREGQKGVPFADRALRKRIFPCKSRTVSSTRWWHRNTSTGFHPANAVRLSVQVAPLTEGEHVVEAILADPQECKLLQIETRRAVPADSPAHLVGPSAGDCRSPDPPRFPSSPRRTFQQMSAVTVLRAADYPRMPWKNGGGSTEEITRDAGEGLEGFGWRLSIADIGESGGFSTFEGYQRVITVLQGAGMVLQVDGEEHAALLPFDAVRLQG